MALTCPADLTGVDLGFTEFIDCDTISVSLDILGVATISFTVIATSSTPEDVSRYTTMTLGGVEFSGYVSNLEIKRIPGTLVYEHSYTITGIGCRN